MICPKCGKFNPDGLKFCEECGTKIEETANQNPQQTTQQQFYQPQYQQPAATTTDNTKIFSILSYLGILFLIGLIADPKNEKLKFHVNQGCVLFIVEIVLGIAVQIVSAIVSYIPAVGYLLTTLVALVVYIGLFALAIMGILNASKGEEKQLPVIGKIVIIK